MRNINEVLRLHFEHGRAKRENARVINVSPAAIQSHKPHKIRESRASNLDRIPSQTRATNRVVLDHQMRRPSAAKALGTDSVQAIKKYLCIR